MLAVHALIAVFLLLVMAGGGLYYYLIHQSKRKFIEPEASKEENRAYIPQTRAQDQFPQLLLPYDTR